jgi:hypothetical protein
VSFRLQHQEDIKIIAESAGFNDPVEYEYLADHFVRLPRKAAVVSTLDQEPFLITADDFEAGEFNAKVEESKEAETLAENYEDERTFLESIDKEPFLSVLERRTKLGWIDKKYSGMVDDLLRRKKIERVKIRLGRGSPKILYQRPGTIPGVRHQYYVHLIAESLAQKGYHVIKNNNGPDIEVPGTGTAIEVELGTSNISGNLKRDLQEYDRVIVCSDDLELIQTLSAKNRDSRILFLPVRKVAASFEKLQDQKDFQNT